jgi:hypothetical protein
MFYFRRSIKFISILTATALLMFCLPLAGIFDISYATDGQDLQLLLDATPEGGTLNLTKDYAGKKNSWGYNETVTIRKSVTIAGPSGMDIPQRRSRSSGMDGATIELNPKC